MENPQKKNINSQEIQPKNAKEEIMEEEKQFLDPQILEENLEEVANLKSQIETLQDKLLRTVAEAENTRRRLEKTIIDTRDYAIFSFAKDMLTVNDNLSRALNNKPQNVNNEIDNIIMGVEMTKNELVNILTKYGLESVEPAIGDKFDCNIHHAISQIVSSEYPQDSIITVMQLGYKIKDRLLRPAAVQVTKIVT